MPDGSRSAPTVRTTRKCSARVGYDDKINVDGFGLIHTEFVDQLVLLPSMRLQKTNPAHVTRTGNGVNYTVNYTYTYDGANRPRSRFGDMLMQSGADAGQHVQLLRQYSYCDE